MSGAGDRGEDQEENRGADFRRQSCRTPPEISPRPPVALSGRPADEITLDAVRAGELSLADLRIHPETLERQAVVAAEHGNPQLAANLRRAAELTSVPDEEVLAIYEALRPGRSSAAELTALAESLALRGLPLCAALVTEAAEVYVRRGLTR
jgi:propanediol dehydratase small subunit